MLEYTLLFLEIVLFAVIGYIYWRTRMMITNLHTLSSHTSSTAEQMEKQTEMMREFTTLITEWEGVADVMQADLGSQQVRMEETLGQAEVTITKLQELVAQVEMLKVKQVEPKFENYTMPPSLERVKSQSGNITSTTLVEAIKTFSEYLRANHYGQSSINHTINYVQKFAAWLGGQAEVELPLRPIVLTEIELYRRRLEAQHTPIDIVEREVAALKMFANWINTLGNKIDLGATYSTVLPSIQSQSHQSLVVKSTDFGRYTDQNTPIQSQPNQLLVEKLSTQSSERYHTALALAQQGIAPATITAQTGLEREAVRLLLMMGSTSLIKN